MRGIFRWVRESFRNALLAGAADALDVLQGEDWQARLLEHRQPEALPESPPKGRKKAGD
jgi:hypothetical protein